MWLQLLFTSIPGPSRRRRSSRMRQWGSVGLRARSFGSDGMLVLGDCPAKCRRSKQPREASSHPWDTEKWGREDEGMEEEGGPDMWGPLGTSSSSRRATRTALYE
jgi:hypothetical protein